MGGGVGVFVWWWCVGCFGVLGWLFFVLLVVVFCVLMGVVFCALVVMEGVLCFGGGGSLPPSSSSSSFTPFRFL